MYFGAAAGQIGVTGRIVYRHSTRYTCQQPRPEQAGAPGNILPYPPNGAQRSQRHVPDAAPGDQTRNVITLRKKLHVANGWITQPHALACKAYHEPTRSLGRDRRAPLPRLVLLRTRGQAAVWSQDGW